MTRTISLAMEKFSKGQLNTVMTDLDLEGLKALAFLGGRVSNPAALSQALAREGVPNSRHALVGGRLLRRLETLGFVRTLQGADSGFEITVTGQLAADHRPR